MTQPAVKKDSQGRWSITGVRENTDLTQMSTDYADLVKASKLIPGERGMQARALLRDNPALSGGMLASLVENGAVPNNPLVRTLQQIDIDTKAQRQQDALMEEQRIATERFNKTLYGRVWTALKGVSRGVFTVGMAPFELIAGSVRGAKQAYDDAVTITKGGKPESEQLSSELNTSDSIWKAMQETVAFQALKQLVTEGRIDLGTGFFPDHSTGAAFAAREKALETAKIAYKVDGKTVYRPYSVFDPVTTVITGGNADTAAGAVVTAVGDFFVMWATDPFLAVTKAASAAKTARLVEQTSEGVTAAKAATEATLLEAKLDEAVADTQRLLNEYNSMVMGPKKILKRDEYIAAFQNQMKIADEYDNIVYDTEKIAKFLTSSYAGPAIDYLATEDDWFKIYQLGKNAAGRGGFTVEQSKLIAAAKDRESVLKSIAPFIADGKVVSDVLETGTRVGRFVKGAGEEITSAVSKFADKVIPGQFTTVVNTVRGLAATGIKSMPYVERFLNETSVRINGTKQAISAKKEQLLGKIPRGGTLIHAADKDALIHSVMVYGRAAGLQEPVIRSLLDTIAYADDVSKAGYTASAKLFDEIFKANVTKRGINPEQLKEITRVFESAREEMSTYWAQRHAAGAELDYVMLNGKKVTISGPHLDSEYLNSMIFLPSIQSILRETSALNRYVKTGKIQDGLDVFTNSIWKRTVLVRPAYIIRNIAEEQIRVLGTGHISFFNNPMMAMAMWLGRDGGPAWRRLINKFDPFRNTVMGNNFKLATAKEEFELEVMAHDAKESYLRFMGDRAISSIDSDVRTSMVLAGFSSKAYGHSRWWEGLANEIRVLHASIAGKVVASTRPGDELRTIDFLLNGAGRQEWERFANLQNKDVRDWLLSVDGAMNYLFTGKDKAGRLTSVLARIEEAAGRNGQASSAIKELIANGKFEAGSISLIVPKGIAGAENSIRNAAEMSAGRKAIQDANQEFAAKLKDTFDGKGDWNGILMNVPIKKFIRGREPNWIVRKADQFFNVAIKFEKTSTMGPEWRQKYWDAIVSLSKSLDSDAVIKLEGIAKQSLMPLKSWNGKPIGKTHGAWEALKYAKGDGNITAEMAHEYASTVATRHVADLFYDASTKRLLFHQLRLILPFGQAWEDTIHAWGRIALNNPIETYKVGKTLQWLSKPESSALYQLTDARDYYDPNQGFFFNDPVDGQKKFYIPYASTGLNFLSNLFLKKAAVKGPYAVSATPQSFNFAFASGSIIPGVGPVLSMSVKVLDELGVNPLKLLPVGLRESAYKIIFPFGEPNFEAGFLEAFLPGNWRRILAPVLPDAAYASSFAPIMNYLASSGGYNLDDANDQLKLIRDTDTFAKWFTISRGVIGLVSPFPFQMSGITTLNDGNTLLNTALYNDFKQLEVNAGGDKNKAYADFLDLYGPEYIFAIVATSTNAPTNLFTYEKLKQDPSVMDIYPDTYGYFYPGGGFSQQLYQWQRRLGSKETFNPKELMARATQIRYYAAKERLMERSIGENWSSSQFEEASRNLSTSYAGKGLKIQPDVILDNRVLSQLRKAVDDQRFNDSDAVAGLRDYLFLRDKALKAAGVTNDSLDKKSTIRQREWLAEEARKIIERYPDFQKLFYVYFKKELQVD